MITVFSMTPCAWPDSGFDCCLPNAVMSSVNIKREEG
jgi:hypothetical protein